MRIVHINGFLYGSTGELIKNLVSFSGSTQNRKIGGPGGHKIFTTVAPARRGIIKKFL